MHYVFSFFIFVIMLHSLEIFIQEMCCSVLDGFHSMPFLMSYVTDLTVLKHSFFFFLYVSR